MSVIPMRSGYGVLIKRVFDFCIAGIALCAVFPLLVLAAVGIKMTSPGPIFFQAQRAGCGGQNFSMWKFRTMHVGSDKQSAITAPDDQRVFKFGFFLRRLKIDELPQFWNILIGDMSLVGPRPEDIKIVGRDYTEWMYETLTVAPGVTSPGAVYGYIFGNTLLDSKNPETSYAEHLLRPKLALERAYLERANFNSDLYYIGLTAWAIIAHILGRQVTLPRIDTEAAKRWAPDGPYHL